MKILLLFLIALVLIALNGPLRNGGNFQDLQESEQQKEKIDDKKERNIQKEEYDQFDDDFGDEYDEEYIEKDPNRPTKKAWWRFWD